MNIDPDNEAIDTLNNIANSLATIADAIQQLTTKGISVSVTSNPYRYPVDYHLTPRKETNR